MTAAKGENGMYANAGILSIVRVAPLSRMSIRYRLYSVYTMRAFCQCKCARVELVLAFGTRTGIDFFRLPKRLEKVPLFEWDPDACLLALMSPEDLPRRASSLGVCSDVVLCDSVFDDCDEVNDS